MSQLPENPLSHPTESAKKVIELSREALAKKLGIAESDLPDRKFFKIVDEQLDTLAGLDPAKKAEAIKKELARIDANEAADKAKELATSGIDGAKKMIPAQAVKAVEGITESLKSEGFAHGKEAVAAVGAIVGAGSIGEATKGIDGLTKAIDASGKMISTAMKSVKELFSSFFQMLGLDKFFRSIGRIFGMDFPEKKNDGKKIDDLKKNTENVIDEGVKKVKEYTLDKEKLLADMNDTLAQFIEKKYFSGRHLSKEQLEKLKKTLSENLDLSTLQKIQAQYTKDGTAKVGDVVKANMDFLALLPAKTFFDIALSGIIPTHKIVYHTVLEPSKNLIQLTLDGLPFVDMQMSMHEWSSLLSEKAKKGDSHALDLARIELYAVNGILWKALGAVTSGVAAGGIAILTDTVTRVDGFKLGGNALKWDFDALTRDITQIERVLNTAPAAGNGSLGVLIERMQSVSKNYLILDLIAQAKDDPATIMKLLREQEKYKSLKMSIPSFTELENSITNKELFQKKLSQLLTNPADITRNIGTTVENELSKFVGGREGAIRHYIESSDELLRAQTKIFLSGNVRKALETPIFALKNLKMARSADSVILHIDDMADVSKLRAFLSVIPGGLKGLAAFIPATAVTFSIGSIAWDNRDKEGGVYKALMDVAKTVFVPAYGAVSMLFDRNIDVNGILQGKFPSIGDMALTGAVGGVAVFESIRVVNQLSTGITMMKNGAHLEGWKTVAKAPFRGVADIKNAAGSALRGYQNIKALASVPTSNPAFTKGLVSMAAKMPHKGRLGIGVALLVGAGGAYAYLSGPEKPEDVMKHLKRDGWLDTDGKPTDKLKGEFQQKNNEEKKQIIDELFIVSLGKSEGLPRTQLDNDHAYVIIGDPKQYAFLIDSEFRRTIQSLGVDIELKNIQ